MTDLNQKNASVGGVTEELKGCSGSGISSALPLELLIEILSRLPAKSLCRFSCVSKQWLHLLSSDPHFKSRHRRRSLSNPILVGRHHRANFPQGPSRLTSIDSAGRLRDEFPFHGDFEVLSSCFNLVCIHSYDDPSAPSIYICNVSTHEVVEVRALPPTRYRLYNAALGVLPSLAMYKLVVFESDLVPSPVCRCEALTLVEGNVSSGSRREIDPGFPHPLSPVCQAFASVVGFIYWLMDSRGIVSMDLESERFGFINYLRDYTQSESPICV